MFIATLFHVKQFCAYAALAYPGERLLTEELEMCECGVFLAVEVKVEFGIAVQDQHGVTDKLVGRNVILSGRELSVERYRGGGYRDCAYFRLS